jgi:hypothetical protein
MMEAASTSETSVNFYQTTRRNNLKESYLQNRTLQLSYFHYEVQPLGTMSLIPSSADYLKVGQDIILGYKLLIFQFSSFLREAVLEKNILLILLTKH